jgi:glycosyltransferase involved in cell wall biosynthesis
MNRYGVSIIICCYNGEARLPKTIQHICEQQVASYIPWELIIVDNGSSDRSMEVAMEVWYKNPPRAALRLIHEPNLGLNNARMRGFKEAAYEYMVMCDDDNWLSPNYISNVCRIMSSHPKIGALGANGILEAEIQMPAWFINSNIFASGPQAPSSGKVLDNRVYGAGCIIRKSAYQKLLNLGFQSLLTDRKGNTLTSGGDYELCYALAILGYDIWYDERLQFIHHITKERLTFDYYIRYARESSKCIDVLFAYKYIANEFVANEIPAIVIARNYFYFVRKYFVINFKRLTTSSSSHRYPMLLFKNTAFQSILFTFSLNLPRMLKIHHELLKFKEVCAHYRALLKTGEPAIFTPSLPEAPVLRPFRQANDF